jgi:hypothetical protein
VRPGVPVENLGLVARHRFVQPPTVVDGGLNYMNSLHVLLRLKELFNLKKTQKEF